MSALNIQILRTYYLFSLFLLQSSVIKLCHQGHFRFSMFVQWNKARLEELKIPVKGLSYKLASTSYKLRWRLRRPLEVPR